MLAKLIFLFAVLAYVAARPQLYGGYVQPSYGYGGYPSYSGYGSYSNPLAYTSYGSYGYPYDYSYGYY